MASLFNTNPAKRVPEQVTRTVDLADGSLKVLEAIPYNNEVTYLEIANESTAGQTVFVGYGRPADANVNPIGNGFARVESIDQEFRPFSGQVFVRASADGAIINVQRRLR